MAWIESHQSLSRHRKTLKTAGRLSVDRHKLIGHLHELWWWALDNVGIDGELTDLTPYEISLAAQWDGEANEFVDALVEGGFIDNDGAHLVLHDWYDYAGKLIERRLLERERSKARRRKAKKEDEKKEEDNAKATSGQPVDDQRSTVGTVPNRTVPKNKDLLSKHKVFDYQSVVDLFHESCPSMPKVIKINANRKTLIRARHKDHGLDGLTTLFTKAEESDFLTGRNGKWKGASFDWLLKDSNALKVLEGNYDNVLPDGKRTRDDFVYTEPKQDREKFNKFMYGGGAADENET